MDLTTERLKLISCSVKMLESLTDNTIELHQLIGVHVPSSWPPEELSAVAPYFISVLNESHEMQGKLIWFIVEKSENMVIGSIGFKNKPDENGTVEIGFGLDFPYRQKGFATEAAKELTRWALSQNNIKKIIADCDADNYPSIRVLEKILMQKTSVQENMIYWELQK